MKKLLLISPDQNWLKSAESCASENGYEVQCARRGREGQLMAARNIPNYIFIDMSVSEHSAVEVLKSLHGFCRETFIFAFINNTDQWEDKDIIKLGVRKILRNLAPTTIVNQIKNIAKVSSWSSVEAQDRSESAVDEEMEESDDSFTSVKLEDYFEDVLAVTDLFIRIGNGKYIKIVNQGEKTSSSQFKKYAEKGAKKLYFRTQDRMLFVSYQNELAAKAAKNANSSKVVIKAMKTAHEKLIEEIEASGVQPELLEEGKKICLNMFESARKDTNLKNILKSYEEFDPESFSEAFLVSFFSTIICKNLDWVGPKTMDTLALGALLHDVGFLKLPAGILKVNSKKLTPEQRELYESHPHLGIDALKSVPGINQAVLDIIVQHHECMDATGFPKKLSGIKIYPLAKIVGLADGFSNYIREKKVCPLDGVREFAKDQEQVSKYDSTLIKNLILGIAS